MTSYINFISIYFTNKNQSGFLIRQISLLLIKISLLNVMTSIRKQFIEKDFSFPRSSDTTTKDRISPTSTNDSSSPRDTCYAGSFRQNKQKSQLCKKFVETGSCPYQKKCKFAHGSHELKKNNNVNSKYKTKQCGVFINDGCCMYGNRCNFIHQNDTPQQKEQKQQFVDLGFMQVKTGLKSQSRLLQLLQ